MLCCAGPCVSCCLPSCSGLLYCMEYLEENLEEWMSAELEGYGDEDYLVFDCPGQVGDRRGREGATHSTGRQQTRVTQLGQDRHVGREKVFRKMVV